jgi:hypothetical protein
VRRDLEGRLAAAETALRATTRDAADEWRQAALAEVPAAILRRLLALCDTATAKGDAASLAELLADAELTAALVDVYEAGLD